ncbi:MAG: ABC transporter ATP-binding protein [Gemmatimonadaceae bacterium]
MRRYLLARRGTAALAAFCAAVLLAALVVIPQWAATLIREVLPARHAVGLSMHLAYGLALALVVSAASFGRDYLLTSLSIGFAASLRDRLLARLLRQPNETSGAMPVGERIARVGSDVLALQHALVRGLAIGVPNMVTALCLLMAMLLTSALLTAGTILLAVPMLWLVALFGRRLHGMAHQSQRSSADMLGSFGEALDGLREAKVFGREGMLEERVRALSQQTVRSALQEERLGALHPAAVTFLGMVGLAGLVLVTATLYSRGVVTNDAMVRFLVLLGLSIGPLQESTRSTGAIMRCFAIMDRIAAVLAAPVEEDAPTAIPCPRLTGSVTFDGTVVARPLAGFALGPLVLSVAPGEVVAIIGASGSGKSTLLDLVTRLVEPTQGVVRVDGLDVRGVGRASLRAQIALVPQDPLLFRGTLAENIRFGRPDATDAELAAAVAAAHVEEIVARLPRGLATPIDARGANLSVGQRQRIALARALLRDPRILLLDEPSAALDVESERLLLDSLRRFCVNRTTLLVTHRAAMLAIADRIVVLERGRIVRVGTLEELTAHRSANELLMAMPRATVYT